MIFIPIILILVGIVVYFLYGHYKQRILRIRFKRKAQPYRQEWTSLLIEDFPLFEKLSPIKKDKLLEYIGIFYFEKNWHKSFNSQSKILEAAKACLPILNRKTNFYNQIKDIQKPRDFKEWLSFNEEQFISEHGKFAHRQFKGKFLDYSHLYFFDTLTLKQDAPKCFEYLKKFYA